MSDQKAFFITVPHSGEEVPSEATWLKGLSEAHLMCDVDRFVDKLYEPATKNLGFPCISTRWHRYVVDLNRVVTDVDKNSVETSFSGAGTHTRGLHWVQTTKGQALLSQPMSLALHKTLVEKYFEPFHQKVRDQFRHFQNRGFKKVYHLDAHSMPSRGESAHRDPGESRPDIVVSDEISVQKTSCSSFYSQLVRRAFEREGFLVAHNWPYKGGGITKTYGSIEKGQHTLQVELNRKLYMNEETRQIHKEEAQILSEKIKAAVSFIYAELPQSN